MILDPKVGDKGLDHQFGVRSEAKESLGFDHSTHVTMSASRRRSTHLTTTPVRTPNDRQGHLYASVFYNIRLSLIPFSNVDERQNNVFMIST